MVPSLCSISVVVQDPVKRLSLACIWMPVKNTSCRPCSSPLISKYPMVFCMPTTPSRSPSSTCSHRIQCIRLRFHTQADARLVGDSCNTAAIAAVRT